jgi:hypothetical protein
MYNVGSLLAASIRAIIAYALAFTCDPRAVKDCTPFFCRFCNRLFKKLCRALLAAEVALVDDVLAAVPAAAAAAASVDVESAAPVAVPAVDAVVPAVLPAALVPVNPCNRFPNDAVRFAVAALAVPPAESC